MDRSDAGVLLLGRESDWKRKPSFHRRRWTPARVVLGLLPPSLLREWAAVHLLRRALLLLLARLGLVLVLVRRLGPSRGRRVGRPVRPLGRPLLRGWRMGSFLLLRRFRNPARPLLPITTPRRSPASLVTGLAISSLAAPTLLFA